jgi:RimJ/RimL family protein N-acetyltransferase
VLRGAKVGLRARQDSDVMTLQAGLHDDDVATWVRSDGRPWQPIPAGSDASPYRVREPADDVACFSVVVLADDNRLAGDALLWGIDRHNRSAHLGIALLPQFRGQALGADVVRVLCHYGFALRGMHRLQVDTLVDNEAMLRAATGAGFTREGVLRRAAWVDGAFVDEVILGLLADEWSRGGELSAQP